MRAVDFDATLAALSADWGRASRVQEVDQALLDHLPRFLPSARFEIAANLRGADPEAGGWSRRPGEMVCEIPFEEAGGRRESLLVYHRTAIRRKTLRRLRLLVELASRAREGRRHRSPNAHLTCSSWRAETVAPAPWNKAVEADAAHSQSPMVRDATFLSAILPFALAQARRHREPLALLCIAIDRISGIANLLGRELTDRLVTLVGETVASMIRSSDIVCRLEDDRILTVLPRAAAENAGHVAQSIRHAVAASAAIASACPGVAITVSIGIAAYPTHATDVFSLFDAADLALAQAHVLGPDQVAMAPLGCSDPTPTQPHDP